MVVRLKALAGTLGVLCAIWLSSQSQLRADPVETSTSAMDEIVATDARGWVFNRYDRGSMRNVAVVSKSGDAVVIRGDYTFNRGKPGWVKVSFNGERVLCLEFWDFKGNCRPLGQSPSQKIAADALAIVLNGEADGEPRQTDGDAGRRTQDTYIFRPSEAPARQPDPPRTPPIGGSGGLYGCASPPCW